MKSKTKTALTNSQIECLVEKHFAGSRLVSSAELTSGMFNTAYALGCAGGNAPAKMILKVGPLPDADILTYEQEIMRTEISVYKKLPRENLVFPQLFAADTTRSLVPADCFFMEYLEGKTWKEYGKKAREDRSRLMFQLGQYNAAVHSVKGERFGYPKRAPRFQHDTWSAAFKQMVGDILADGKARGSKLPYTAIAAAVEKHTALLDEVKTPSLVDFDMWAGNIFLAQANGHFGISGVVDFERAFYGDPAADFTSAVSIFEDVEKEPDFVKGYEAASRERLVITDGMRTRMNLYRLYMAVIMKVETYRYNKAYANMVKMYCNANIKKYLAEL